MMPRFGIWLLWLSLWPGTPAAVVDAREFPNEELRARYDQLIYELRCPQCLNINLAGSDGAVAKDLRREVHRMLLEGRSDREILNFMQARYGDFILYRPPLTFGTLLIWLGPFMLLLGGFLWLLHIFRRQPETRVMTEDERAQLEAILQGEDDSRP